MFLFDRKLGRFILNIIVTFAGFLILGAINESLGVAFLSAGLVTFAHQLCWDIFDFAFLDNKVGRIIKRVVFFGVVVLCIAESAWIHVSGFAALEAAPTVFEIARMTAALPAAVVAALLAHLMYWYINDVKHACFLQIEAFLIGFALSIGCAFATNKIGLFFAWVVYAVLILGVGAYIVLTSFKKKWIYYDAERGPAYESASRTRSNGRSSHGRRTSDSVFFNSFSISMNNIARRYSTSKTLQHGVLIVSDVDPVCSDNGVTFEINLKITGGSFRNQAEVDQVVRERDAFIKYIAQSTCNDAGRELANLRKKYNNYDGQMNISAEVGRVTTG